MPVRSLRALRACLVLLLATAACSASEESSPPPDVAADTASDATADTASDASADTAPDVTADTAPDVTADTAPDVTADTAPDASADTAPDAAADTAPDVAADTTPDVAADTTPDVAADTAPDVTADTDTGTDTGTEVRGRVTGRVIRALSGDAAPLAGVRVWAGEVETLTDADGFFALDGVVGPVARVEVAPTSLAAPLSSSLRTVTLDDGDEVFVPFELLEGCAGELDLTESDATLEIARCGGDRSVQLTLPRGGVLRVDDGTAVSRVAAVLVPLPIGPRGLLDSGALAAFPGDMTARAADGAEAWLDSRGAIEVRLTDAATGEPVALADGAIAEIVFPADPRTVTDAEPDVPAWWFDTSTGVWNEDPTASSAVDVDATTGQLVHRMQVSHFTWWNADRVAERTCVTGAARYTDGSPALGVVVSRGVDYLGESRIAVDSAGNFEVAVRTGSLADVMLLVQDGTRVLSDRRRVLTGPFGGDCVDAGVLEIDRTDGLTCARGRVVDSAGLPVAGATVTAWSPGRWVEAETNEDGSYCLAVEPDVLFDLVTEVSVGSGWLSGRTTGRVSAGAPAVCAADGGSACSALPDLTAAANGCIRGTVFGALGGVAGASVTAVSPAGVRTALSDSGGAYCMQVDGSELQSMIALLRRPAFFGARSVQQLEDIRAGATGSTCDTPEVCAGIDFFLADVACTSGQLVDPLGAPVAGARVLASLDGSAPQHVATTGTEGQFCVTGPVGAAMNLVFNRYADGVRTSATARVDNGDTLGACGSSTCTDAGVVVAEQSAVTGCVTGRLRFGDVSVTTEVLVDVDGTTVSVMPDRTGTFCADVPPALVATLRRAYEQECATPPEISLDLEPLVGGDCRDVTSCLDAGELDFEDFCSLS